MKEFTIGVLGGMGTYATIHLFQQYAEVFPAEKEWDRPRIIIDNRCTMPSRVRAFLYKEKIDELVDEMTDSMQHLVDAGCNRVLLACNTSHLFLPQIYKKIPNLEDKVIDIIHNCVRQVKKDEIKEVFLLASEGTIDSAIYQDAFKKEDIKCTVPRPQQYGLLRKCIEAVKQNNYTDEIENIFCELVKGQKTCILDCTELPILYEKFDKDFADVHIYDPLLLGLRKLKEEYDND